MDSKLYGRIMIEIPHNDCGDADRIALEYHILRNKEETEGKTIYGGRVDELDPDSNKILLSRSVKTVTPCKSEIESFIHSMLINSVSALHFQEIAKDYIEENFG